MTDSAIKNNKKRTAKKCPICGIDFTADKRQKYCSRPCAYQSCERKRKISESRVKNGNSYRNDIERMVARKWSEYNASSKRRSLLFSLSKEQFADKLLGVCFYCGSDLSLGVDRKDSNKGYTNENAVGCCSKCNFAKHTMSVGEFREHITLLYFNFVKK